MKGTAEAGRADNMENFNITEERLPKTINNKIGADRVTEASMQRDVYNEKSG